VTQSIPIRPSAIRPVRVIRRFPAVALCLLWLAVCIPGGAQAVEGGPAPGAAPAEESGQTAAAGDDSRALAARILARDGYQTELPGVEHRGGTGKSAPPPAPRRLGRSWSIPVPRGLGALLELLVWIGAGALALVVVVTAIRMAVTALRDGRRAGAAEEPGASAPSGAAPVRRRPPPPGEAEALAAAGRYSEAVHALLVRALAALGARRGRAFPDSATSREILATGGLAPAQRTALGALVAPVERAVFGGADLGADDWERCRAAYRSLEAEG